MGRFPRVWLLIVGLLGCLTGQAASPVWAIRGAHATVYLAGSVHLLKADDATLPSAFDRAYSGSHRLVMELAIDKVDPMEAATWMMAHGMLKEGRTLRATLGEDRYRRVSVQAGELGVPMEAIDQLEPWVVALQFTELQYAQLGFDPQRGVEEQLTHRAVADSKPIEGLETLDQELGVLQSLSYPDQARFLDLVVTQMPDVSKETQAVIAAWRAGDAAQLAALLGDEYRSFPVLYRALVTQRNQRWLPRIEQLAGGREDCLVVVGALHLVGENGLLQLLRHDGYDAVAVN